MDICYSLNVVVEIKIHITESGSLLIIPVFLLDLVSLVGSWLDKVSYYVSHWAEDGGMSFGMA